MKEFPVSELTLRLSVYGVAIRDDKVLLVPTLDGYDLPGGGMDIGEHVQEALVREVREETGLTVKPLDLLLIEDSFFFHPYRKKPFHTPLIYFLCEIIGGEISDKGFSEHEKKYAKKAEWVPLEKVSQIKFYNPIDKPKLIKDAEWLQRIIAMGENVTFRRISGV